MVVAHLRIRPSFATFRKLSRTLGHNLPPLNFITIHYAYFIGTCLLTAIIFWGSSTPSRSVSFTDALFLTTSAMTLAGLNTVNLSAINTFQQTMLFLLIIIGSAIFVSAFVVHVRRRAFERKFRSIAEERHRNLNPRRYSLPGSRSRRSSIQAGRRESQERIRGRHIHGSAATGGYITGTVSIPPESGHNDIVMRNYLAGSHRGSAVYDNTRCTEGPQSHIDSGADDANDAAYHISFSPETIFRATSSGGESHDKHHRQRFLSMQGVGACSSASLHYRSGSRSMDTDMTASMSKVESGACKHFPSSGLVARNSSFYGLNDDEREQLGGAEYKAIQFLAYLVPLYFFLWQVLGCIGLGAYVANKRPDTAKKNGLNPWWVGIFNSVSAFNNSGMSLLDANMVAFQTDIYMLITMGLLILAGNTCFPIFLRLIIWSLRKLMPENEKWHDHRCTLQFLLDHPRRCYTNLFPSQHTWWLLLSVVTLNGIDWAAFEILNIGNKAITNLDGGTEVIDGLFQAFAVRSGGFYVVTISSVRISLQVLYVVMMYISVYPVVITMRNSNVYEERSLGIYADDPGYEALEKEPYQHEHSFLRALKRRFTTNNRHETTSYFVRQQLRAQLAHDAWWIVLAVFLITIVEGGQFERDPAVFSVFNVIFEVVSGYGCVGISVGLPDEAYSFCGSWHTLSKLILCAVMIRGRHRGLPVAIDKAVLLPGEDLQRAEEEDARIRLERSVSRRVGV